MITKIFEILGIATFILIDYYLISQLIIKDKTEKKRTAKVRTRIRFPKIEWKQNYQWILIVLFTILIVFTPWIFTNYARNTRFDFTDTGGIGDTINGIAGPFIAWMGAILVFIAFREQVKANKNLKNQNDFNLVIQNLNKLEEDNFDISLLCTNADNDLNNKSYDSQNLKRVTEVIRDFRNMTFVIDRITEDEEILKTKINLIWDTIYRPEIDKLNQRIVTLSVISGLTFMIGNPLIFNQEFVNLDKKIESYGLGN